MKIAHVSNSGGIYGKEQVILTLAESQQELGYRPVIFGTGSTDLVMAAKDRFIDSHYVHAYSDAMRFIIMTHFDIVHLHDYKSSIIMSAAKATTQRNLPPLVRTVHGYTAKGRPWHHRMHLYEFLDRQSHRFHDAVVGVSPNMEEDFGLEVIRNGIPKLTLLGTHLQKHIVDFCDKDHFIIGCTARLSGEKNLLELVKSMKLVRNNGIKVKLVILGEGRLKRDLLVLASELGLHDYVMLPGFVDNAKDYLQLYDLYVQPSLTEGTPISVLEAMSYGVPLMVTAVGGMAAITKEHAAWECGIDSKSIATSLNLLTITPTLRQNLVSRASDLYEREYSSKAMTQKYLELYNRVLKEK